MTTETPRTSGNVRQRPATTAKSQHTLTSENYRLLAFSHNSGVRCPDKHAPSPQRKGSTMNNEVIIDYYRPFDQRRWLGDPPWSGDELIAWETAHGHDVRMKCYVEYGCQAVIPEAHEEGRRIVTALVQQAIVDDVLEQTREGEACVRVETLRGLLHDDLVRLHEGDPDD